MSYPLIVTSRRSFCFGATAALVAPVPSRAAELSAMQIMQSCSQTTRFDNARFSATLSLTASGKSRQRNLIGVAKLVDQGAQARMLRFVTPADMAGVATLTVERGAKDDDLWIFLPAARRVRRLVTANRADPWVGSDFSFGDILGHKAADWQHEISGAQVLPEGDCWRIKSTPAAPRLARETGYGSRQSWVRKADFSLIRCDFFGPNGDALKSAYFGDFRVLDGRLGKVQPMTMAVRNIRKASTSVLRFNQFGIGQAVRVDEISPEALGQ